MQLSISQASTAWDCPRKWWFQKVIRLPMDDGNSESRTFGTVLHGVVERWLKADPDGRTNGQPVNLYPPGWQWDQESRKRISPEDEAKIKILVDMAIQQGVLQRHPDAKVEDEFFGVLNAPEPGEVPFAPEWVTLTGKIDYHHGQVVEDHKTVKTARYVKSIEKLLKDPQLLLYALVVGARQALRDHDQVTIRHNVFLKEPEPKVTIRETKVSMKTCWEAWARLKDLGKRLLPLAQIRDENKWHTIPGALDDADTSSACSDYGGCPFLGICSRSEKSIQHYRLRLLRMKCPESAPDTMEGIMSIADKIKKAAAAAQKTKAAPAKAPAKKAAPVEVEVEEEEEETPPPPVKKGKKAAPAPEPEEEEEEEAVEVEETAEEEAPQDSEEEAGDPGVGQVIQVLTGLRDVLNQVFPPG